MGAWAAAGRPIRQTASSGAKRNDRKPKARIPWLLRSKRTPELSHLAEELRKSRDATAASALRRGGRRAAPQGEPEQQLRNLLDVFQLERQAARVLAGAPPVDHPGHDGLGVHPVPGM